MSELEIWTDSVQTGKWCEKCRLPSAVTAHARTVGDDGVGPGGITFTFCPDCADEPDDE